jgi:MOSC domain-containing protein YiiM
VKVVSVSVGLPQRVVWHGRTVSTAIFKQPVEGRVTVRRLNLDGDGQADLSVHGGEAKAVYCYAAEHYAWWTRELRGRALEPAMFGENLTTSDVDENSIHLGDELSIGSARFVVTQPRLPCYKLGIRFQSDDMVRRFLESGRSGFYLRVSQEGDVAADDPIKIVFRDPQSVRVGDVTRLYIAKTYHGDDLQLLKRALLVDALPDSWKEHFRSRLVGATG